MMGKVLSIRVTEEQVGRLARLALQMRMKPSQTAAALLEESLRMDEFLLVEFRDTAVGRQAYVQGTRLKVWMVEWIARNYDHDVKRTAEHLSLPAHYVEAALDYARAYPQEIEEAITDNSKTFEEVKKVLPNVQRG